MILPSGDIKIETFCHTNNNNTGVELFDCQMVQQVGVASDYQH